MADNTLQAAASKGLATAILESVRNNMPSEPNWWSMAIELAAEFHTSEQYQIWLALREILAGREKDNKGV